MVPRQGRAAMCEPAADVAALEGDARQMRVSVIGIGHVGAVTAACLARDGHEVQAVDTDPRRLDAIASSDGVAPGESDPACLEALAVVRPVRITGR
jgi:UDP-N-acetyl-D-mannosaminuronate dehydrogenase